MGDTTIPRTAANAATSSAAESPAASSGGQDSRATSGGNAYAHYKNDVAPLNARQVASNLEGRAKAQDDASLQKDLQNYLSANPRAFAEVQSNLARNHGNEPGGNGAALHRLSQANTAAEKTNTDLAAELHKAAQNVAPQTQLNAEGLKYCTQQAGIITPKQNLEGAALNKAVEQSYQDAGLARPTQQESYTSAQIAALRHALTRNNVQITL